MPQFNQYTNPAVQLPLTGSEQLMLAQTQAGVVQTVTATVADIVTGVAVVADLASFVPGVPSAGLRVRIAMTGAITLPAALPNSEAIARVAATAAVTVTLNQISGGTATAIGTVNWAAGATVGTFTFSSAVSFAAGQLLEEFWPTPADSTLADVAITLHAFRQ